MTPKLLKSRKGLTASLLLEGRPEVMMRCFGLALVVLGACGALACGSSGDSAGAGSADVISGKAPAASPPTTQAPATPPQGDAPPATETAPAGQTPCHTDGCVMRRQAEWDAVIAWIGSNDECSSVVAWTQAVARLSDTDFAVTCGDSEATKFTVRVPDDNVSTDPKSIKVTQIAEAPVPEIGEDEPCHTDGCVMRRGAAFEAVTKWVATQDDCVSVVVWQHAITRKNDETFGIKCGDTEPTTFDVHIEGVGSGDPSDITITRVT